MMHSEEQEKLTKELLQKAAPLLDKSFEDDLMLQIEAMSPVMMPKNINVWYRLLWLNVAILGCMVILFLIYFEAMPLVGLLKVFGSIFDFAITPDFASLSFFAFGCLIGCFFVYFFDLLLNDYFTLKNLKIELGRC